MENPQATYTILIVDDVPNNIKIAASILQKEGYELFFATSGSDALEKTQETAFDLILLDVMMPKMDGFAVCARLKNDPGTKDTPIMFLTAKTDTQSIVKGFQLGAVDYVTKPFNSEELVARVKTHLTLRQAQKDLQKLNRTKDRFLSILAHDLRSPFTALLNLTDLIIEHINTYTQDEVIRFLGRIQRSAKRVYELLENLLTWSSLQQGGIEYHPARFNFANVARRNVFLFQTAFEEKQLTLHNLLQEELLVHADQNMIDTVVRNLFSNAIKFTNPDGIIKLVAENNDDTVFISVSDTGVGISTEQLSQLFRIDRKHTTPGTFGERGSGLGLILCKELVEKNGGHLWVESQVGYGSTFRFSLPAGKENTYE